MSDATTPCRVFHRNDSNNSPSTALTSSSERPLYEPSIPENCKRRVDLATAGEGLSGERCLIENTDGANIVHYAHCLPRETKEHILDALEFSWGMDHLTLNIDTHYNVFRLSSKFHALYSNKSPTWLLLPEERILREYYKARNDRTKFPDINDSTYEYTFLADKEMVSVPIHRLTPPDSLPAPLSAAYTYFPHPYTDLAVKSHVHPRFVICDVGKKMEDGSRVFALCRLYPDLVPALEMAFKIWKAWTTVTDKPGFNTFCKKSYTGDSMSSTSRYTSKRRVFPPTKKRGRDLDESPTRSSKRPKQGRGQNDCIWLDDEILREHGRKDSPKRQWKNKKVWISDWTKDVSKTGIAVEQATDLDMVTNVIETQ